MGRSKKQQSAAGSVDAESAAAPDTTIVVPCYNEAGRLRSEVFLDFARDTPDTHLLFVNDGSTDETLEILNGLRTSLPNQVRAI